jgi:hypothetical protein
MIQNASRASSTIYYVIASSKTLITLLDEWGASDSVEKVFAQWVIPD